MNEYCRFKTLTGSILCSAKPATVYNGFVWFPKEAAISSKYGSVAAIDALAKRILVAHYQNALSQTLCKMEKQLKNIKFLQNYDLPIKRIAYQVKMEENKNEK